MKQAIFRIFLSTFIIASSFGNSIVGFLSVQQGHDTSLQEVDQLVESSLNLAYATDGDVTCTDPDDTDEFEVTDIEIGDQYIVENQYGYDETRVTIDCIGTSDIEAYELVVVTPTRELRYGSISNSNNPYYFTSTFDIAIRETGTYNFMCKAWVPGNEKPLCAVEVEMNGECVDRMNLTHEYGDGVELDAEFKELGAMPWEGPFNLEWTKGTASTVSSEVRLYEGTDNSGSLIQTFDAWNTDGYGCVGGSVTATCGIDNFSQYLEYGVNYYVEIVSEPQYGVCEDGPIGFTISFGADCEDTTIDTNYLPEGSTEFVEVTCDGIPSDFGWEVFVLGEYDNGISGYTVESFDGNIAVLGFENVSAGTYDIVCIADSDGDNNGIEEECRAPLTIYEEQTECTDTTVSVIDDTTLEVSCSGSTDEYTIVVEESGQIVASGVVYTSDLGPVEITVPGPGEYTVTCTTDDEDQAECPAETVIIPEDEEPVCTDITVTPQTLVAGSNNEFVITCGPDEIEAWDVLVVTAQGTTTIFDPASGSNNIFEYSVQSSAPGVIAFGCVVEGQPVNSINDISRACVQKVELTSPQCVELDSFNVGVLEVTDTSVSLGGPLNPVSGVENIVVEIFEGTTTNPGASVAVYSGTDIIYGTNDWSVSIGGLDANQDYYAWIDGETTDEYCPVGTDISFTTLDVICEDLTQSDITVTTPSEATIGEVTLEGTVSSDVTFMNVVIVGQPSAIYPVEILNGVWRTITPVPVNAGTNVYKITARNECSEISKVVYIEGTYDSCIDDPSYQILNQGITFFDGDTVVTGGEDVEGPSLTVSGSVISGQDKTIRILRNGEVVETDVIPASQDAFSYDISLVDGSNSIQVVIATINGDEICDSKQANITVNYNPEEVACTGIDIAPSNVLVQGSGDDFIVTCQGALVEQWQVQFSNPNAGSFIIANPELGTINQFIIDQQNITLLDQDYDISCQAIVDGVILNTPDVCNDVLKLTSPVCEDLNFSIDSPTPTPNPIYTSQNTETIVGSVDVSLTDRVVWSVKKDDFNGTVVASGVAILDAQNDTYTFDAPIIQDPEVVTYVWVQPFSIDELCTADGNDILFISRNVCPAPVGDVTISSSDSDNVSLDNTTDITVTTTFSFRKRVYLKVTNNGQTRTIPSQEGPFNQFVFSNIELGEGVNSFDVKVKPVDSSGNEIEGTGCEVVRESLDVLYTPICEEGIGALNATVSENPTYNDEVDLNVTTTYAGEKEIVVTVTPEGSSVATFETTVTRSGILFTINNIPVTVGNNVIKVTASIPGCDNSGKSDTVEVLVLTHDICKPADVSPSTIVDPVNDGFTITCEGENVAKFMVNYETPSGTTGSLLNNDASDYTFDFTDVSEEGTYTFECLAWTTDAATDPVFCGPGTGVVDYPEAVCPEDNIVRNLIVINPVLNNNQLVTFDSTLTISGTIEGDVDFVEIYVTYPGDIPNDAIELAEVVEGSDGIKRWEKTVTIPQSQEFLEIIVSARGQDIDCGMEETSFFVKYVPPTGGECPANEQVSLDDLTLESQVIAGITTTTITGSYLIDGPVGSVSYSGQVLDVEFIDDSAVFTVNVTLLEGENEFVFTITPKSTNSECYPVVKKLTLTYPPQTVCEETEVSPSTIVTEQNDGFTITCEGENVAKFMVNYETPSGTTGSLINNDASDYTFDFTDVSEEGTYTFECLAWTTDAATDPVFCGPATGVVDYPEVVCPANEQVSLDDLTLESQVIAGITTTTITGSYLIDGPVGSVSYSGQVLDVEFIDDSAVFTVNVTLLEGENEFVFTITPKSTNSECYPVVKKLTLTYPPQTVCEETEVSPSTIVTEQNDGFTITCEGENVAKFMVNYETPSGTTGSLINTDDSDYTFDFTDVSEEGTYTFECLAWSTDAATDPVFCGPATGVVDYPVLECPEDDIVRNLTVTNPVLNNNQAVVFNNQIEITGTVEGDVDAVSVYVVGQDFIPFATLNTGANGLTNWSFPLTIPQANAFNTGLFNDAGFVTIEVVAFGTDSLCGQDTTRFDIKYVPPTGGECPANEQVSLDDLTLESQVIAGITTTTITGSYLIDGPVGSVSYSGQVLDVEFIDDSAVFTVDVTLVEGENEFVFTITPKSNDDDCDPVVKKLVVVYPPAQICEDSDKVGDISFEGLPTNTIFNTLNYQFTGVIATGNLSSLSINGQDGTVNTDGTFVVSGVFAQEGSLTLTFDITAQDELCNETQTLTITYSDPNNGGQCDEALGLDIIESSTSVSNSVDTYEFVGTVNVSELDRLELSSGTAIRTVDVDAVGAFRVEVDLSEGRNEYTFSAISRDSEFVCNDAETIVITRRTRINGGGRSGRTSSIFCGNGRIDSTRGVNEMCDDGNTRSGDGCSSTCQIEEEPVCGNGIIEIGEMCDDDNLFNGDGCSSTCDIEDEEIKREIVQERIRETIRRRRSVPLTYTPPKVLPKTGFASSSKGFRKLIK